MDEFSDKQLLMIQVFDLLMQSLEKEDRVAVLEFLTTIYCEGCGDSMDNHPDEEPEPSGESN